MKFLTTQFIFILLFSVNSIHAQEIVQEVVPCNKQRMNPGCDDGWFTLGLGSDSNDLIHAYMRANFGRDFPYQITIAGSSSIFGGPAIAWGGDIDPTLGVSANAQINIAPLIPIGLGLDIYGVATPNYKMVGIGFSFVIEGHK